MQHDLGELGLTILEKAYGRFDQDRRGALNRIQFVQALLLWMGIHGEEDQPSMEWNNDTDDAPDPVRSLLHKTADGSLQTSFGRTVSFKSENAKNAARLLKSTDSGRMRSPPLVDKFRRAKEASTMANMRQPNDGRLGQLERMFRQVDTNHNGFIDSREMEIILNKLRDDGQRASKLEVKSVMDFVDANGDRLVGFDEFIRVMGPMLDNKAMMPWRTSITKQQQAAPPAAEGNQVSGLSSWLVILPNNTLIHWWDTLMQWLAVFFFVTVPVDIAFRCLERWNNGYYIATTTLDSLLIADCLLYFVRAFVNTKSVLVTDLVKIRKNYLGHHFLIDVVAACPFDLLIRGAGASLEFQAWIRGFKLLRMIRLYQWYKRKQMEKDADSLWARVKSLTIILMAVMHIFACAWWYIGTYNQQNFWNTDKFEITLTPGMNDTVTAIAGQDFNMTDYNAQLPNYWVGRYQGFGLNDMYLSGSIWQQYLLCFYWVLATISTNGQVQNMVPKNLAEILFGYLVLIASVTLVAYVLGAVSNVIMDQDAALVRMRTQVLAIQKFVTNRNLPERLKEDITRYVESSAVIRSEHGHQEDVFSLLSHTLQVEVAKHMSRELIGLVEIFDGCNSNFLDSISVLLHEVNIAPDNVLFRANEVSRELYIIASGMMQLLVESDDAGVVVENVRSAGQVVGEMGFFFGMRYITHAKAAPSGPATLFALPKADFSQLIKLYPDQEEQITKNILQSWGLQHTMKVEVKRVLEMAKHKKRNERVVRLVDAAARGSLEEVDFMLGSGDVEVDDGDYHQRTALHLAASNGHIAMVRHLVLQHGAYLNVVDRYGGTPMMDAVRQRHAEVVAFLKRTGAVFDADVAKGALFKAAVEGDADYLELLILNGMLPNSTDYNERTPLHLAASHGHVHIVRYLCHLPGINVNPEDNMGDTPLMDAIRQVHLEVQDELRQHGGNVGSDNVAYRVCEAASEGRLPALQVLVENGVDPNLSGHDQRTALHVAVSCGQAEIVLFLLGLPSINVNPVDCWGHTPLHNAHQVGDTVMQALLERHGGLLPDHPELQPRMEAQKERQKQEAQKRNRRRAQKVVSTSKEAALGAALQRAADASEALVADTEQACILVHWMLQEMADMGLQATRWNPAKEEMEMLLRKASRQALALLEKLEGVMGSLVMGPHLESCITRLMCPQAHSILHQLSRCLISIPILLTRTLVQGSETEFYFEEWDKKQARRGLPNGAANQGGRRGQYTRVGRKARFTPRSTMTPDGKELPGGRPFISE
ncbi:hypothetical protein WJX84_004552 [Apatococcus fuscideae]|uniref:Uncharacterized protein n=1 Tax=Apatococcus fuscideae TaxID=2026836 RepID=A0AAW1SX82_9CHLO